MSRTTRRAAAKAVPSDAAGLLARIAAVALPEAPAEIVERARRLLFVTVETAAAQGLGFRLLVDDLASGRAALRIAMADLDRIAALPNGGFAGAACAQGCAFCCLIGDDPSPISEAERAALHAALAPQVGATAARAWHPKACPALDPESRMCRAYAARPILCRSYTSTDAGVCERNARGEASGGAAVAGAYPLALAVQGLVRAALAGLATVPTYDLRRTAEAALAGAPEAEAREAARQPPKALRDTLRGLTKITRRMQR